MLKSTKILLSNKHTDCTHNASFTEEKAFGVWQRILIRFCCTAERWMCSRKQK